MQSKSCQKPIQIKKKTFQGNPTFNMSYLPHSSATNGVWPMGPGGRFKYAKGETTISVDLLYGGKYLVIKWPESMYWQFF